MKTRKEIKGLAKAGLKRNYWFVLVICFILSFLGIEFRSSVSGIVATNEYNQLPDDQVVYSDHIGGDASDTIDIIFDPEQMEETEKTEGADGKNGLQGIASFIEMLRQTGREILNTFFENHVPILDFVASLEALILGNWKYMVLMFLACILILLFWMGVRFPVKVGSRRCYLDVSEQVEGLDVRDIKLLFCLFQKGIYWNTIKIMIRQWFFHMLWSFTIIGGFIKGYEYTAIPFILAENPNLDSKTVFALAKDMMRGNKWKLFVLDVSYIGWDLLTGLTFGLSGIFWANPYHAMARTEYYVSCRDRAAEKNPQMYKELIECDF